MHWQSHSKPVQNAAVPVLVWHMCSIHADSLQATLQVLGYGRTSLSVKARFAAGQVQFVSMSGHW